MIELLLAADRLLAEGSLERAERIYGQIAESDPRNAMAVVGLARVAVARGQVAEAGDAVRRALEIDPDDALARQLEAELAERAPLATAGHPRPMAAPDQADAATGLPASLELRPARRGWFARFLQRIGFG